MAVKTYLEPSELTQLMANARCDRDRVIIAFLSDTGCRVSELLNVKVEHIDLETGSILIPHLKRGIKKKCPSCGRAAGRSQPFCSRCGADLSKVKAEGTEDRGRIISIGDDLTQQLKTYTEEMKLSQNLISVSRQMVWHIIRQLAETIGLKGKCIWNPETRKKHYVHPHIFRDSLAVSWLSAATAEGDVGMQKALQDHLGHKNFETTMRYNKLSASTVRAAADKVRKRRFSNNVERTADSGEA
jgi:integrase